MVLFGKKWRKQKDGGISKKRKKIIQKMYMSFLRNKGPQRAGSTVFQFARKLLLYATT
jgi:hypothetical protein